MISAATGRSRRECATVITIILLSLLVLSGSVAVGRHTGLVAVGLAALMVLAVFHVQLLSWKSLLGLTLVTILFVPIRRYSLPASLPLQLELYRIVTAVVILFWLLSIMADSKVTFRKTGLELPIGCYLAAILLSLCVNPGRANAVGSFVVKNLMFFISFFVILYIIVSVVRTAAQIDLLVRVLVIGGSVVAFFALVDVQTQYNVFNHLSSVFPFLRYDPNGAEPIARGGALRVYGSAQHPIAMGAAFALLLPLAIYLAHSTRKRLWWLAATLMLLGLFATRSRTGIIMLIVIVIVFLVLRPRETRRWWPALIPIAILVHFALPGTIGSIRDSFFPQGGLIAQEDKNNVGSGRLATFWPAIHSEFTPNPMLGEGAFTRVTVPTTEVNVANAPILDDQWLGILLDTGVVGFLSLLWVFVRSVRRMGKAAKRDLSPRGWLLVGTTASVVAYMVSMLTYDSFAFIQATVLLFVVLGIGIAALRSKSKEWAALQASR